jgi:hypothetical protein
LPVILARAALTAEVSWPAQNAASFDVTAHKFVRAVREARDAVARDGIYGVVCLLEHVIIIVGIIMLYFACIFSPSNTKPQKSVGPCKMMPFLDVTAKIKMKIKIKIVLSKEKCQATDKTTSFWVKRACLLTMRHKSKLYL